MLVLNLAATHHGCRGYNKRALALPAGCGLCTLGLECLAHTVAGRKEDKVLKSILRPIPAVRQLSLARQRAQFHGSARFWEQRYAAGGTSGPGSYGDLARAKAQFLNSFVRDRDVKSIIEFGCGDGHQLSLADYPSYIGLDVSRSAIKLCKTKFSTDESKSFYLYDGDCFVDHRQLLTADMAISLDVIFHLVEDRAYEQYMAHLFDAAERFTVIYATNAEIWDDAPHVRHRRFADWVGQHRDGWELTHTEAGSATGDRRADFYVYERRRRS